MGAVSAAIGVERADVRRGDPDERPRRADPHVARGGARRHARGGRGDPRAADRHRDPPEDHVPAAARPERAAGGLRARHRALELAERRRQDQLRARPPAGLHVQPRAHGPVRRRRARALGRVPGDGVRGGARGAAVDAAVLRRRGADVARPDARAGGQARRVAVHAVGAARVERGAAPRGAGVLRRPRDRGLRRAGARLRGQRPASPGDRAVRHGARVGPDRRQHLPRRAVRGAALPHAAGAGLRGLPHADPRPVPMLQRHARRRRRHRHPGLQLRPGDQTRPQAEHTFPIERFERDDRAAAHDVPVLHGHLVPEVAVLPADRRGRLHQLGPVQPHADPDALRRRPEGVLAPAEPRDALGRGRRAAGRDHRPGRGPVHAAAHAARPVVDAGRSVQVRARSARPTAAS